MNDNAENASTASRAGARLTGRTVILTGAAGNIGAHVSRALLREGARVVMTGRNRAKLEAFIDELAGEGFDRDAMCAAIGDCADPDACRAIVAAAIERFGELHVLINNAGGPGPKQTLENIPLIEAEARANGDDETLFQAAMNLLGGPWNMTRAAMPHLAVSGAIVNVSTIFSRTPYFGRIPYVVPKSALNALSEGLAHELGQGDRGIRVNTVFPGPIESDRIHAVFGAMDKLQEQPEGTTSKHFKDLMITRRLDSEGAMSYRYPDPTDVAQTLLWLATPESEAFSGHAFEVTNGMQVPAQSRSKLVSWPDNRLVDLRDQVVLVLGGSDVDEALEIARRNRGRGASVVLAFRTIESVGRARAPVEQMDDPHVSLIRLDPLHEETVQRAFQLIAERFGRLDGVVMLPKTPNGQHGHSLSMAEDRDVEAFVREEIVAPVAFARALTRSLHQHMSLDEAPAVSFLTNPDDGHGNRLNEIKRAAVEALIRVWRLEEEFLVRRGDRRWSCMPNQIVRFDNSEPDNLAFTADWTATLNNRVRKMDPITLWVPRSILRATGKSAMPMSIQRVLPGLHHGKCAVITGASLGIGLQLGRYLAMAGARVLLSARSEGKLGEARDAIIEELRGIGYPRPEERVHTLAGIDVGDEAALQRLFEHAIEKFGEVDYLINNAGISGAEEMVVDTTREAWNRTMEANLISNYSLIRKFAPHMKARGSGRILNVSSYFGGEKYLAVAYPNRADYAVSKAGQRGLAEILSRHLGPQIQINAMAPGPVDGARLRGLGGAPGLFDRRARLILENKRLNQVHRAMLAILAEAERDELLERLAVNEIEQLNRWDTAPQALRRLIAQVGEGRPEAGATRYLLSRPLAAKLMERLVIGGVLDRERADAFLDRLEAPDQEPGPGTGSATLLRGRRRRTGVGRHPGRHHQPAAPAPHADRRAGRPVDRVQPGRRQRQRRDLPPVRRPEVRPLGFRRRNDAAARRRGPGTPGRESRRDDRGGTGRRTGFHRRGLLCPAHRQPHRADGQRRRGTKTAGTHCRAGRRWGRRPRRGRRPGSRPGPGAGRQRQDRHRGLHAVRPPAHETADRRTGRRLAARPVAGRLRPGGRGPAHPPLSRGAQVRADSALSDGPDYPGHFARLHPRGVRAGHVHRKRPARLHRNPGCGKRAPGNGARGQSGAAHAPRPGRRAQHRTGACRGNGSTGAGRPAVRRAGPQPERKPLPGAHFPRQCAHRVAHSLSPPTTVRAAATPPDPVSGRFRSVAYRFRLAQALDSSNKHRKEKCT